MGPIDLFGHGLHIGLYKRPFAIRQCGYRGWEPHQVWNERVSERIPRRILAALQNSPYMRRDKAAPEPRPRIEARAPTLNPQAARQVLYEAVVISEVPGCALGDPH